VGTSGSPGQPGRAIAALGGAALVALLAVGGGAGAAEVPRIRDSAGLGAEVLVDRGGSLGADAVASPPWSGRFVPTGGPVSLGLGQPPAWVRFRLENASAAERSYSVAWDFPLVERLDLFLLQDGKVAGRWRGGLALPSAQRTIEFRGDGHVARVVLPPGAAAIALFRAETRGALFAGVSAWEGFGPRPGEPPALLLYGVGVGVVLVLAGLALAQFAGWRDEGYLWYAAFVLSYGGYGATVTGLAPLLLWPGRPDFALVAQPLFSGATGFFGALFIRSFLETRARSPRLDRILKVIAAANLAAGLAGFVSLEAANAATAAAAAATLGLGVYQGIATVRYQPVRAGWYLAGFGAFSVFGILFALTVLGALRPHAAFLWGLQAGFALTGVALALALAERRVGESEERFRVAFETSPDAIAINRIEDGVYVAINEGFTRICGWKQGDVVGRSSLELSIWANPEDRTRMVEELRAAGTVRNREFTFRFKDGRVGTGLMSARVIHLEGKPFILSITREISELKAAEAERARLRDELRQSQKMDAIGRLAGGVAHDFNNLLTAISANVGLGLAETAPGHPVRPLLEDVEDAVRRATVLTRQLLAFSRRQPVSRRWISLSGLVEGMRKLLGRVLGEDVRLELSLATTPLVIVADRGLVEQVVMNLVVNARDAIAPGGRIAVETRAAEIRESSPDRPAGRYAVLEVRDDGQGMDAETRGRIFEPFFTTKPGDRGTGIGLATVYGIVRQHGGAIEVRSEPGKGSAFEVYWPMAEGRGVDTPVPVAAAGAPLPTGSETLLLVEDEVKVREPTRALLERLGYRVLAAGSGAEALATAAAHPGPIDLVVTDVVMPAMNGAELSSRLRAARPATPVLFISGYDDRILARHGFDETTVELLPKPFTAEALASRVRALLDAGRAPGARRS
jgi:PAS domain S-box-containing protein